MILKSSDTSLISSDYQNVLRQKHKQDPEWGPGGIIWIGLIVFLAREINAKSIIDYGCGKGGNIEPLSKAGFKVQGYDPGVDSFSSRPSRAELTVCLDVLEHVEPDKIENVLADIKSLSDISLFVISMRRAKHRLPNGENAHLLIQSREWWSEALSRHWDNQKIMSGRQDSELLVLCW